MTYVQPMETCGCGRRSVQDQRSADRYAPHAQARLIDLDAKAPASAPPSYDGLRRFTSMAPVSMRVGHRVGRNLVDNEGGQSRPRWRTMSHATQGLRFDARSTATIAA